MKLEEMIHPWISSRGSSIASTPILLGGRDCSGISALHISSWTAVMIPTLLVHLMGGIYDDKMRVVQILLFVGGINILLQTLFGTRLPTVIGGSYVSVVPIISIIHDSSLQNIVDDHQRFIQTMRAIQGALIVSSSIQIILGYIQLRGICSRFFSPLGMVPMVVLAGFGLFDKGFPVIGRCVETVFDGRKLGIEPFSVEVVGNGELLVLDSVNSNLYQVYLSLSRYSRSKLVAGSAEGMLTMSPGAVDLLEKKCLSLIRANELQSMRHCANHTSY